MDQREIARALVLVWLAAGFIEVAASQPMDTEQLLRCAAEPDDAIRLACYDNEVAKASPAVALAAQAVGSPPEATRVPPPDATPPQADFGVQGSEVARKRVEEERRGQPQIKSIDSTVTALVQQPRGEVLVELDNGQTWRQKRPESYFPLRVGDRVTIVAGALGSYRMTVPSGRSSAVTRVK